MRYGAGIGTIAGAALPMVALTAFAKRGGTVPGVNGAARHVFASGSVLAFSGVAAAVGTKRAWDMAHDDGHYGKLGSALGIEAGFLVGSRVLHTSPVKTAGLTIVGGIVGAIAGAKIHAGLDAKGHIGEPIASPVKRREEGLGVVQDFARGTWNHFVESGPISQGVSFGYTWRMQDKVAKEYSNSEQAGAMFGDLSAAAILAGGALGTAKALNAAKGGGAAAEAAFQSTRTAKVFLAPLKMLQDVKGAKTGMFMAAGLLTGAGLYANYRSDGRSNTEKHITAGVQVAATAGAAMLMSKTALMKSLNPGVQAAASTMTAAVLVAALSAARVPVQQFMRDSSTVAKDKKSTGINLAATAGIGALGGFVIGTKVASSFNLGGWKKGAAIAVGTGAMALMGSRFAPVLPSDKNKVGISALVGAGAGVGSLAFMAKRDVKTAIGMGVLGAAAGIIGSSMLYGKKAPAEAK